MAPNFILEKEIESILLDGCNKNTKVEKESESNIHEDQKKKKKPFWSTIFTKSSSKISVEKGSNEATITTTAITNKTIIATSTLNSTSSSIEEDESFSCTSKSSSSSILEEIDDAKKWRSINPLIHLPNIANESIHLYKEISLDKFSWIMEGYSWITEGKAWYIINPYNGKLLFNQIVYNSSGWPLPPTCQSSTRYFDPQNTLSSDPLTEWSTIQQNAKGGNGGGGGGHIFEYFANSMSKVKLNKEKCEIKMTMTSQSIDSTGINVDFTGKILSFDLRMTKDVGLSFDDGNVYFGADQGDGILNQKFIIGAPTEGILKRKGNGNGNSVDGADEEIFTGISLCVHQFQGLRPNLIGSRWNFCNFVGVERLAKDNIWNLFMIQVKTSQSYGSAIINKGSIHSSMDGLYSLSTNDSNHSPNYIRTFQPILDPNTEYYLPKEIEYCWSGKDLQGRSFKAICRSKPKILVARINVLEQLPFVFRKVIEALVSKPFIYQWLNKVSIDIEIGGHGNDGMEEKKTLDGWILEEIAIVSEDFRN